MNNGMFHLNRLISRHSASKVCAFRWISICKPALDVQYDRSQQPCLAIRRETINAWERRAPLSPVHVRRLVRSGVKVLIQPSNRRAFPAQQYVKSGAIVQEDISEASIIMGVKAVNIDDLIPGKTYAFFSHTIKAQKDNMPLLDAILQRNIRLIDYERMVDDKGQRLVAFGKWAGFAGMIDILHGLGLRLLALGHHTPFIHIGLAHNYRDSHGARNAIREAGYEIALGMMPRSLGPLTFVFTGSGNVSQGAQEIFSELPCEFVTCDNLSSVAKHGALNKVYACVVRREDHIVRKDGGKLDPEEFELFPERYNSVFANKIAPYTSVLVNGVYWAVNSPRLITIPDAKMLSTRRINLPNVDPGQPTLPHRLTAICDISADPGGSIEFMTDCTTIDKPFCMYDATDNKDTDKFDQDAGILVCSIDNMPAQMPIEATSYFGDKVFPYIHEMLASDSTTPFEQYNASPAVKNAVITSNGELTPNFQYISQMRQQQISSHKTGSLAKAEYKVLLLGAGYVSGPLAEYLCRDPNVHLTVAADTFERASEFQNDAQKLVGQHGGNIVPTLIDVQHDADKLDQLVGEHNMVVSLLPYAFHPTVAKLCIKHNSNMVTASYCSPEMWALHASAVEAGITIVNEVGLDPGIDHLLAVECFDSVKERGGTIQSFVSFCGGLPAPECSDNPLRYKFSWSPKGVLLNTLSGARFRKDRNVVDIGPGGEILNSVMPVSFMPGFALEGFPNRDSTIYSKLYDIETAHTILRGTLRYKGFTEAMKALHTLKLIDTNPHSALDPQRGPHMTWKEFIATLVNQPSDIFADSLRSCIFELLGEDKLQFDAIEKLGLFSTDVQVERLVTPLDALASYLSRNLAYGPNERDLALMRHDVGVRNADGSEEIYHVDFSAYGNAAGFSAMAATVGYTAAIATKMVLNGEIQRKGMVLPFSKDIYRPMLKRLEKEGFHSKITIQQIR